MNCRQFRCGCEEWTRGCESTPALLSRTTVNTHHVQQYPPSTTTYTSYDNFVNMPDTSTEIFWITTTYSVFCIPLLTLYRHMNICRWLVDLWGSYSFGNEHLAAGIVDRPKNLFFNMHAFPKSGTRALYQLSWKIHLFTHGSYHTYVFPSLTPRA